MRSPKRIRLLLARYPLTDRITFSYDAPAGFCFGVFNGLSVTFVGIIGRKIGLDSKMLAILSISAFVGLFLNVWMGHLADRGRKEGWVFWPSLVSRFLVALALLRVSPWLYLGVMSAFNIVSTFGGPAYASIMRSNYSDRYRGEIMGYIRILIQISTAISAAIAGAVMEAVPGSFRILFPLAAAFGMASSFLFRKIKVRPGRPRIQPPRGTPAEARATVPAHSGFMESLSTMTRDRLFMAYMAIYFVIGFPDKIVVPLEPIRFVDELGMNYAAAGLIQGTAPLVGALIGYLLYAKLADRSNPFVLLIVTTLLSSTRYLNTALAALPVQLLPGAFLNGVSNAGWDLIPIFSLMLFAGRERLSLYFGFHSTLIGLRGFVGPILGVWLYSGLRMRISTIYLLAFGIELVGAALLLRFYARFRELRTSQLGRAARG